MLCVQIHHVFKNSFMHGLINHFSMGLYNQRITACVCRRTRTRTRVDTNTHAYIFLCVFTRLATCTWGRIACNSDLLIDLTTRTTSWYEQILDRSSHNRCRNYYRGRPPFHYENRWRCRSQQLVVKLVLAIKSKGHLYCTQCENCSVRQYFESAFTPACCIARNNWSGSGHTNTNFVQYSVCGRSLCQYR